MLGMNVVKISSGPLHCAAVTEEGQLYTWGCNDEAALGRTGDEFLPGVVGGALEGEKIVDVTCGDSHTVVLTSKGQVFSWGSYRDSSGVMR